jgi:type IV pilus assembly protein PilV
MMEVLVSIVIVVIGLLGLAGLQSRASVSEMEAFQRAQALVLLQDMVDRINANRKLSMEYVTAAPLGTGNAIAGCITNITATMPREFQIAVVWQGLVPTAAPGATDCGIGEYGDDKTRRAVTANVIIGCLQNNLANGLCVTP